MNVLSLNATLFLNIELSSSTISFNRANYSVHYAISGLKGFDFKKLLRIKVRVEDMSYG